MQELFSASKANESKKKKKSSVKNSDGTESDTPNVTSEAEPIRPKELGQLISDAIVNGDENDAASIKELLEELKNILTQRRKKTMIVSQPSVECLMTGR